MDSSLSVGKAQSNFESFYFVWQRMVDELSMKFQDSVGNLNILQITEPQSKEIEVEIKRIISCCIEDLGEVYHHLYYPYTRVFCDLILPKTPQHHAVCCAMVAPNLMTYEMLRALVFSWVETSLYDFLFIDEDQYLTTIMDTIDCYILACNMQTKGSLIHALAQNRLEYIQKVFKQKSKNIDLIYKYENEQSVRFYHQPMPRSKIHETDEGAAIADIGKELGYVLMQPVITHKQDKQEKNNPIFDRYQIKSKQQESSFKITELKPFIESCWEIILGNPNVILEALSFEMNNRVVNVSNLPFGLLGLIAFNTLHSIVLMRNLKDSSYFAFSLTEFEQSDKEFKLITHISHAALTLIGLQLYPEVKNEQIVPFLLREYLYKTAILFELSDADLDGVISVCAHQGIFLSNNTFLVEDYLVSKDTNSYSLFTDMNSRLPS